MDPRRERALALKEASDVRLPRLKYWSYDACAAHAPTPKPDCEFRACGGELFAHQRVGVMWLYLCKKGLLGDLPGLGKTGQTLFLTALLKERGELTDRMVVICQTPSALQWFAEAQRWTPKLQTEVIYAGMTKAARVERYVKNWDLLIIGWHMVLKDWQMLERFGVKNWAIDDVDPLLNHDTKAHQRIVNLTQDAERVVVMHGTSIQTKLQQLHAALLPAGGFETFGTLGQFEARYVRKEYSREITRSGRVFTREITTGYRHGEELKKKLSPLVLRRTYDDLTDLRMPTLMPPETVWLDLHQPQRERYTELQAGVIRLKRDEGETIKHAAALARVSYGQAICSGLPAIGDPDSKFGSVKLDWVMQQVTGPWEDRKVVCFIKNIGLVKAAQQRLTNAAIGFATVWGQDASAKSRDSEIGRFWTDPNCRVLLGTSSIERSLNLQVANILVNVDTLYNPSRMQQLAGRVRRAGSAHQHVWVFTLLTRDTQEERLMPVLERRQAVADYVWSDTNDLFQPLSPIELLSLISP